MLITRRQLILILAVTIFYLVGQLLTGTEPVVAALFTIAILFGMLAIFVGGGLRSAAGCLNAILIGKFLMIGIIIKIILFSPADGMLYAPRTTALVMALGFVGLAFGTMIQSRIYCPQLSSMNQPFDDRMLLSFAIVLFVLSYLGYFAGMIPATHGEGIQTGGWLGVARALGSLKSLSIVPALLYLWRRNSRRWLMHPLILGMLMWGVTIGIFSTNKQDTMEPFAFFISVGFLRYGWKDIRLLSLASVGLFFFALIVFPYSQYVRHAGGRDGSFEHRAEVTKEVFWRISSNQDFRSTIAERVSKEHSYFDLASLAPFGRLAMVGEADQL